MNHLLRAMRLEGIASVAAAGMLLAALGQPLRAEPARTTAEALIRQAGNAEDDAARLALLRKLQAVPDLTPDLKTEVERLVAFVERWQNDPSLYQWYDRELRATVDYDFKISKQSPLYPITCLYRGRMLVWATNEYGNLIGYHEPRRRFFDKAVEELSDCPGRLSRQPRDWHVSGRPDSR